MAGILIDWSTHSRQAGGNEELIKLLFLFAPRGSAVDRLDARRYPCLHPQTRPDETGYRHNIQARSNYL